MPSDEMQVSKEFAACLPNWTLRKRECDQLHIGEPETPVWTDDQGSLLLSRVDNDTNARYRLRLSDQVLVDISFDKLLVCEHSVCGPIAQPTRDHFLIDQVLPRILGHQGELVLHAAAVRVGDQSIVFLGKSGSGKSTLAASFHSAGYPLLGDDALVVSWSCPVAQVRAVYPSLRLFPDSIEALFTGEVATTSVAHYTPKRRVSVPLKEGVEPSASPIGALFVLDPDSRSSTRQLLIKRKSIAQACMALVENSFVLDPTDTARAPRRLQDASKLAGQVPAFDLCYPRAYSLLPDVQAAILAALDGSA